MSRASAGHRDPTSPEPDGGSASPGADEPASPEPDGASLAGWRAAAVRYAPVAAAAGAMALAGVWGLSRDSAMGNDEVVSRWAALLSLRQLAHLLSRIDAVHGLYYLLLHGWMAVGTSPTVMRIPSVIAMALAAGMLVVIGRRLTGSAWPGLFAGLIMALTPDITYYAQTARSYALVFACVLGQTLVLMRALRVESSGGTRGQVVRWWLLYGVLVTLGGYLNEMALLVLAAHAVTVLVARYGARAVVRWAVAGAAGAVLVVPLMVRSHQQQAALGVIPRPGLQDLWILYHDYFGATIAAPLLLVACAVIALLPSRARRPGTVITTQTAPATLPAQAAGQPALPAPHPQAAEQPTPAAPAPWWSGGVSLPSVALPLLLIPAALLLLESLVATPLYVDRYVLYGAAGAALLAGAGLYRLGSWLAGRARSRTLIWVPGVVVCVCALLLQIGALERVRTPGNRLFNFGGPAQYVGAQARQGDGVLFFTSFFRKARLGYPADFSKTADFALAVPPVVADPFRGIDKPAGTVESLMPGYHRIWVIGIRPSATAPAGSVLDESKVLLRDFTMVTARHYRGMWVTLWERS